MGDIIKWCEVSLAPSLFYLKLVMRVELGVGMQQLGC